MGIGYVRPVQFLDHLTVIKRTLNGHFSRPAETDPYAFVDLVRNRRHFWNVAVVVHSNALIPRTMTIRRRLGTKPMPIERDNKTAGLEASPPLKENELRRKY